MKRQSSLVMEPFLSGSFAKFQMSVFVTYVIRVKLTETTTSVTAKEKYIFCEVIVPETLEGISHIL